MPTGGASLKAVSLANAPHAFARVAAVALGRELPERVPGPDDVALLRPGTLGRPRDRQDETPTAASRAKMDARRTCVRMVAPPSDRCRLSSDEAVEEASVAVDELAVGVDLAVAPKVADEVPVERGLHLPAVSGYDAPSARCTVPPIFSSKSAYAR